MPATTHTATDVDILIHGDGPVGCALALGLQRTGLRVALSARQAIQSPSPTTQTATQPASANSTHAVRAIALSYASGLFLQRLNAWPLPQSTPIQRVHVSEQGAFGQTQLTTQDLGLATQALGHVINYADIAPYLRTHIDPKRIQWMTEHTTCTARLTVHAEGHLDASSATTHDFAHEAIVASVQFDRPNDGTAYERFTDQGPLALLPLNAGYALVWSRRHTEANALMQASSSDFLHALHRTFGQRAGQPIALGERACFPLIARQRIDPPMAGTVHIGNASQTLHPVAGQGLNLGLRDARALLEHIAQTPVEALGSLDFAQRWRLLRQPDAQRTQHATQLLASLFVQHNPAAKILRRSALLACQLLPFARQQLAQRMVFGFERT